MSYQARTNAYRNVGNGTLATNAASATITCAANASTLAGDLIVLVAYVVGQDPRRAVDAGEGWVLLDAVYDSGTTVGLGMWACLTATHGSSHAGLTLPGNAAWTSQNTTYRAGVVITGTVQARGYQFELAGRTPAGPGLNTAGTGTGTDRSPFKGGGLVEQYAQGIELMACGYNNAGTTTTVGNATNFTERFDTGQTSPPHGVAMNDRTTLTQGTKTHYSTVTATLAVTKTYRTSVRAYIPICGNVDLGRARMGRAGRLR